MRNIKKTLSIGFQRLGVDIIVFRCNISSLVGGYGYDLKLSGKLMELSGVKATATSTAVLKAFKALNMNKLAVATPYIE